MEFLEELMKGLDIYDQDNLRNSIEKYVKTYEDPQIDKEGTILV